VLTSLIKPEYPVCQTGLSSFDSSDSTACFVKFQNHQFTLPPLGDIKRHSRSYLHNHWFFYHSYLSSPSTSEWGFGYPASSSWRGSAPSTPTRGSTPDVLGEALQRLLQLSDSATFSSRPSSTTEDDRHFNHLLSASFAAGLSLANNKRSGWLMVWLCSDTMSCTPSAQQRPPPLRHNDGSRRHCQPWGGQQRQPYDGVSSRQWWQREWIYEWRHQIVGLGSRPHGPRSGSLIFFVWKLIFCVSPLKWSTPQIEFLVLVHSNRHYK
jgi:hypothetical protein